jgi:hypothetical protein
MSKAKPLPGQTEIPTGNEIGFHHNPDVAYEQEFGVEKARYQRALHAELTACNCGRSKHHAPGCPKARSPKW